MPPRLVWFPVVSLGIAVLIVGLSRLVAPAPKEPDEAAYFYSLLEKDGKLDFTLYKPSAPMGSDEPLLRALVRLLGPKVAHCTLLAEGVCANKLLRPRLKCKDVFGDPHSLVRANEGDLHVKGDQPTLAIHFTEGEIVYSDGRRVDFDDKTWLIPLSALRRKQ